MNISNKAQTISTNNQTIAENQQKIYEAGKEKEWSDFWEIYQRNNNYGSHYGAFSSYCWNDEIFKPKYDLKVTNAERMFYSSGIKNLQECLNSRGVKLDLSKNTSANYMFCQALCTSIDVLDFSNCLAYNSAFYMSKFVTIGKIKLKDGEQAWGSGFYMASELVNISFEGKIQTTNIDFAYSSLLTHESLMNIINALCDNTAQTKTRTVKLGATNKAKLTTEELEMITQKGWVVS